MVLCNARTSALGRTQPPKGARWLGSDRPKCFLSLTKLNWESTPFDGGEPITMEALVRGRTRALCEK